MVQSGWRRDFRVQLCEYDEILRVSALARASPATCCTPLTEVSLAELLGLSHVQFLILQKMVATLLVDTGIMVENVALVKLTMYGAVTEANKFAITATAAAGRISGLTVMLPMRLI